MTSAFILRSVIFIEMTDSKTLEIPFWLKLNMTIKEASAYSGIGEKTLRNMLSQRGCSFLLKIGNKNMVKRKEFEKYLNTIHFV